MRRDSEPAPLRPNPLRRLRDLFRRDALHRESREELEFHVEMYVRELVSEGVPADEARRRAAIEIGTVDQAAEGLAERRAGVGLESWLRDLRVAMRALRRARAFSIVSVLLIALGVAASTSLFTLVDRVLLRPLPMPHAERLVRVFEQNAEQGVANTGVARGNLVEWRRQASSFDGMALSYAMGRTLGDGGRARPVLVAQVTCDFFPLLALPAPLGRSFTPAECDRARFDSAAAPAGPDAVAMLGEGLWRRDFGADPQVVGRSITVDRRPFRIVGVAPRAIESVAPGVDLFVAWSLTDSLPRDQRYPRAIARLRPGIPLPAAEQELASIALRLADETPESNRGWTASLVPLHEDIVGGSRPVLLAMSAAAALLLLVASSNVSILFLARALARRRDAALRLVLGAPAGRVFRLHLVEAALVAAAGGALGVLLAALALRSVPEIWPDLPRRLEVVPDLSLFTAALATSLFAALVAGWLPARQLERTEPLDELAPGTRSSATRRTQRARDGLVIAEVALTVVLLTAAVLLVRSVDNLRSSPTGFDPRDVIVAPVFLDKEAYGSGARSRAYYAELFERLRALPGVRAVGGATTLPASRLGPGFERPVWPSDRGRDARTIRQAAVRIVTPGYLQALRIPVLEGRDFDERDAPDGAPVIAINQRLARALWPGASAVGRHLTVDYSNAGTATYEVVGVIGDVRFAGPRSEPAAEIYFPHAQRSYLILNVAIRTDPGAPPLEESVRRTLLELDPLKPPQSVDRLVDLVGETFLRERRSMQLLIGFGALASLLSALGLYGLLAFRVRQHATEIGLRLALGARPGRLLRWVAADAARLLAAGLAAGVLLAAAGMRLIDGLLFGVGVSDPASALVVVGLLLLLGAAAAVLPAWRAMRVEPAAILRGD